MEVEEEKKRICKEIDEGKPPLQVNQNHLLHLQELLVRIERHIELDSGIYCYDCYSMLGSSLILLPFHSQNI